jgi:hypothetical protein
LIALPPLRISSKFFTPAKPMTTNTGTPLLGGADPAEASRIEADVAVAERLIQNKRAVPVGDGQAVRFGIVKKIIGGHQAAGAGHVFHDGGRISWNMFADVAGDRARVRVIAAASALADDKTDGFVLVKILGDRDRVSRRQQVKAQRDSKSETRRFLETSPHIAIA